MASNGRKILNTHKKFLNRSRDLVGKGYEKFFVLMLRGAENFCKTLDPEETNDNLGLTRSEVENLTQEQFDNLYKLLLSYFTLALSGDAIPGALKDRISLTVSVVGKEYLEAVMNNIDRDVGGSDLMQANTENATDEVIKLLNASNPDREQIFQTLMYVAFEYVGKQARNISENKYCFIATDIYGSYDHPKVKLFRNFRDQYLENSVLGKNFIKFYYKLSPILIRNRLYKIVLKKPFKKMLNGLAIILRQHKNS